MSGTAIAVLTLTGVLAAANGANDVSKGVATLVGAGVVRYRTALAWGVLTTLLGSFFSLVIASRMSVLFTTGIVIVSPSAPFALAVLGGTIAWVSYATLMRLPVSTTHALVGAMVGAGSLAGTILWTSIWLKVALPLLASIALSYLLSAMLNRATRAWPQCVCVDVEQAYVGLNVFLSGGASIVAVGAPVPKIGVTTSLHGDCAVHVQGQRYSLLNGVHWVTSGLASFARGLNDTPKIWAIGTFALTSGGSTRRELLLIVALSMAIGGSVAGIRVAHSLARGVVNMNHHEGLMANLVTAILVGGGANLGLPMSTTHVSAGAIAGIAGGSVSRLNFRTLGGFVMAWTVTPVIAATIAMAAFLLLR
jgi:PiT family inorganic phosphate transporter